MRDGRTVPLSHSKGGITMKKILTLVLAALMLLAVLPASAQEQTVALKDCGVTFAFPDALNESEYVPMFTPIGIFTQDPLFAIIAVDYYAVPRDEYVGLLERANSGDTGAIETLEKGATTLAMLVVSDAGTLEDTLAPYGGLEEGETFVELGEADGCRFYFIRESTEKFMAGLDALGKSEEEKAKIRSDMDNICDSLLKNLQAGELYRPYDPMQAIIGQNVCFESTDLDGNAVNTADLFRDNRITMLNFWGTWCPNCVNEMKELAEIHTRLREKGCGVVGVEMEKKPIEEIREKALALLAEKGTNYPSVLFPKDFATFDFINTFPTTLFVDSEGNVLTYPIIGALVDEYEKTVDELLAGEAPQAAAPGAAVTEGATGEYHVIITDSEGPVKGVTVQFCDDVMCSFQKTDENGVATFSPETAKVYDVHILKVPDGYAEDETIYNTLDTWSDLNITIEKAG